MLEGFVGCSDASTNASCCLEKHRDEWCSGGNGKGMGIKKYVKAGKKEELYQ